MSVECLINNLSDFERCCYYSVEFQQIKRTKEINNIKLFK